MWVLSSCFFLLGDGRRQVCCVERRLFAVLVFTVNGGHCRRVYLCTVRLYIVKRLVIEYYVCLCWSVISTYMADMKAVLVVLPSVEYGPLALWRLALGYAVLVQQL
jgi:hypothetical protein